MFNEYFKKYDKLAIIDDDYSFSYKDIIKFQEDIKEVLHSRSVMFILSENNADSLMMCYAALENGVVPLLLDKNLSDEFLSNLLSIYKPKYIWCSKEKNILLGDVIYETRRYKLLLTDNIIYKVNSKLALLLSTSGSTGNPKLVRHSYDNILFSIKNVAKVFSINLKDNVFIPIPIHFTQGLNVALSHLISGATVVLTQFNILQKEFWIAFNRNLITSITGVPYSYYLMDKLKFFEKDNKYLKIINQGGGRLPDYLFEKIAKYCYSHGLSFIPTYGSTETTSRMSYLPPDLAMTKCGSIGYPLPNCKFKLLDDNNQEILRPNINGELVFIGNNVTLGYASNSTDLCSGDDRNGEYYTGDIAFFDNDGCYYIVGRKSRFVKIYGYRISLDEVERIIKSKFNIECACIGNDKKIIIVLENDNIYKNEIINYISGKIKINRTIFDIVFIHIPKNTTGKILYKELEYLKGE